MQSKHSENALLSRLSDVKESCGSLVVADQQLVFISTHEKDEEGRRWIPTATRADSLASDDRLDVGAGEQVHQSHAIDPIAHGGNLVTEGTARWHLHICHRFFEVDVGDDCEFVRIPNLGLTRRTQNVRSRICRHRRR